MWLRLALNLAIVLFLSACSPSHRQAVDKLNSISYSYHYRNIDSTEHYARSVLAMPGLEDDQQAEALNNLAFCSIVRMDYQRADSLLCDVISLTNNQIELLVAEVQQMRLCQRRSLNRAFYEHRAQAETYHQRIEEERDQLTARMLHRLQYAESEMAIVNSTYYYYVGLERQSIEAMQALNLDAVRRDTAQYLNYLYNVGAGGILTDGTPEEIHQEEMNYLHRALDFSERFGSPYFKAQALEAVAEHTGDLEVAREALRLFQEYGDVYQIAGAYRTIASCYHAMGDDYQALDYLNESLADERIHQAPDLVASIREQLSVAYSAIDDKPNSDYNRNIYIDLQEQTRQDRELEARAGLLDRAVKQLNWMILAVIAFILLLLFVLWFFNRLLRKSKEDHQLDALLEEKNEEVAEARLRVEKNERRHLEQRAKVSLAMSIMPLIDRIRYTADHLSASPASDQLDYIRELTDEINEQNDLLTQWIQLRQGELSLHIESFALQELFDIMSRGRASFELKGLDLEVRPTSATVKADRVLTLFMLNTLADNARKFTDSGGKVVIAATEQADSIEISVSDTGRGMTADELAHVFDHKVKQGHGFGLMNCKGIIEKYRKISRIFSVCQLQAESEQGSGSRIFFTLPKGIVRMLLAAMFLSFSVPSQGADRHAHDNQISQAHIYADSAYFSNINGTYQRTLLFVDSCRACLNSHYLEHYGDSSLLLTNDDEAGGMPAEIAWFHKGVDTNYQIILDIRNEAAVAALALHEWQLYAYNNKVYTQLFKEMSADNSLADYCRTMQRSQTNKRIAVILLLVLLVLIIPAYFMLYYRHRLYRRFSQERQQQLHIELAGDELKRAELEDSNLHVANAVLDNCLSTLKHETMYYPSRIRQLVDTGSVELLSEVVGYYRELYGILIQQAIGQVESVKLHIRPVSLYGQTVQGDENLLHYLFELLKGDVRAEAKDDRYVVCHVTLAAPVSPIDYLLCRQIVRDHGEATGRRGCGISVENEQVTIILPRHHG